MSKHWTDALVLSVTAITIGNEHGTDNLDRARLSLNLEETQKIDGPNGPIELKLSRAYATVYVSEDIARSILIGDKFRLMEDRG
jgi:hypothetical protein